MSSETESIILSVKKKHKPGVNKYSWGAKKYCNTDMLEKITNNAKDTITRLEYGNLGRGEFNEIYQRNSVPCIITGIGRRWDMDKFAWHVG